MKYNYLSINVREYRRSNQNGQSRESGNIGHTRRRQYVLDTAIRKHINSANKAWTLLQTTVGKYKPNIVFMRKSQQTAQHETQNVKTQWNQSYCVFNWHKGVNVFQELSYFSLTNYRFSLVNKISIQLESYIINYVDITSLISPWSSDIKKVVWWYVSYTKTAPWFLEGHCSKIYGFCMKFQLNHLNTLYYLNMEDMFCHKRIRIQTRRHTGKILEPLDLKDI